MPLLCQRLLLPQELKLLGGLPLGLLAEFMLCPAKLLLEGQLHGLELVLVGEDEVLQLTVHYGLVVDDGEGAGFEGVEVALQVQ